MIRKTDEGGSVEVEVRVEAPMEVVWRALLDPGEIARWFPLEARGEGRLGGIVEVSWGDDQWWPMEVVEAEEARHLRLRDATPAPAEGAPVLFVDYHLHSERGGTVVRLVHSGFAPGDDWDAFLEGLDAGWGYFLRNLKVYLERHLGQPRAMAWARPRVDGDRAAIWGAVLEVHGVDPAGLEGIAEGAPCAVRFDGRTRAGVLEAVAPGRTLGVRLPDLDESLLFLEVEAEGANGRVGMWVSTYGLDTVRVAEVQAAVDGAAAALAGRLPVEDSAGS
jgi:uncharacterized protein YndB with AHSA1/START domain